MRSDHSYEIKSRKSWLALKTMIRGMITLLVILLLSTSIFAQRPTVSQYGSLAFTHTTVIDMTGAPPKSDMTVIIVGARIKAIGKSAKVKIPEDARIVNANGKYLIPGLWDMHAHTRKDKVTREIVFPLEIANGVTGTRVMAADCIGEGGCRDREPFEVHLLWKKAIAAGSLVGPRLVLASTYVDGPHPLNLGSMIVNNAAQARDAVRTAKRQGVDFIKIHNNLSRESYFALADESKKLGISFAGHVPWLIGAIEAANAGQKSEEHLFGVLEACSGREAELLSARERLTRTPRDYSKDLRALVQKQRDSLSYDGDCKKLFQALVKHGTWVVPTFNYWRAAADFSYLEAPRIQDDGRLRYLPLSMRERWESLLGRALPSITQKDVTESRRLFRERLAFLKRLLDAGVGILPGTDCDVVYTIPGFNVHDELAMFVEGGLTPMEALQTATRDSAKYLNVSSSLGTVAKGKLADLVLLEANPLEDIHNTAKIGAVVVNGRYFPSESLQKMLSDVEEAAKKN